MEMADTSLLLFLSLLCLCLTAAIRRKKNKLPPGPFPPPLIGNLFKLGAKPHQSLTKLANTYGPLMTLKLGSVTTVIASSPAMAKEILQINDLSFSSRTIPDSVRALQYHKFSMAWLPASSQWRNLRKLCNTQLFTNQKLESNQGLRQKKVEQLVAYVDENCKKKCAVDIGQVAFSTVLNLISNTVFSIDLTHLDSDYAQEFKALVRGVMEEVARPNFGDYFPVLRSFDVQGIRRRMEGYFGKLDELFDGLIKQRLECREKGVYTGCSDFLDTILDYKHEDGFKLSDADIKSLFKDIFIAGTGTTSSTVEWAMAELLHNPKAMVKAKLELQQKIGKNNPIHESHIADLPYLQAIIKETLRLRHAAFLLPRKAESNVEICNYIVPKNTQVLINLWTICHDPNVWENPNMFIPDRFLNSNIDVRGRDFELIPFGSGRRICPGFPLAYRMLHLILASLLHGFDWELEDGLMPEDMNMEDKFSVGLHKATPMKAIPIKIPDE